MIREWLRIGWHADGISLDRYYDLTWAQRRMMHEELSDLIDRVEEESEAAARPKQLRR